MAIQIQLRQGTTTEHNTFTGAVGEVTVDTTKDVPVVHDGVTVGGFPVASKANADGTISLIKKDGTSAGTINADGLFNNTLTSTNTNQALTAAQGKVLNDQAFGVGQSWVNVRSTRLVNTIYTNDTDKPISVSIANPNVYWNEFSIVVGGVVIQSSVNNYQLPISIIFNVPVGATYRVNSGAFGITGGVTAVWAELR